MAKRIGPEAKIIALFTALPEDSKRIVFDVIKSQTATTRSPKSSFMDVPAAQRRSLRKLPAAASAANTEVKKDSALAAGGD